MRFKLEKDPELGSTRNKIKFAWLPTVCQHRDEDNAEYVVWLGFYHCKEVYEKWTSYGPGTYGNRVIGWRTNDCWIYDKSLPKKW